MILEKVSGYTYTYTKWISVYNFFIRDICVKSFGYMRFYYKIRTRKKPF